MQYRTLGKSPLRLSGLTLGAMMFGDRTDKEEAGNILALARERGVNSIDTADVYASGESEAILGDLLRDRNQWIIATKLGNATSNRPNEGGFSRAWMLRNVDCSLRRLQTEWIDILYLHRDAHALDLEEPLRAIDQLLRDGKIRYWGISNFRGWRIAEAVHVARKLGMPDPVACQPHYNLLNRMAEADILPACTHYGVGVASYSPIARGVLTGKYLSVTQPLEGSRAGRGDRRIAETEMRAESLVIAQKLKEHATSRNISLANFATAWVLASDAVSTVIAGPRTLGQFSEYFEALEYSWTSQDERLVDAMVRPGHSSTPGYTDPGHPIPARNAY